MNGLKEIVIALATIVAVMLALFWCGEAFRANPKAFGIVWMVTPVVAYGLNHSLAQRLTIFTLRRARTLLMVLAIGISFLMAANYDFLRNRIGARFVDGYEHWRAEPDVDDYGRQYYPGDDWTTAQPSGKRALELFGVGLFGVVVVLPILTWKAGSAAVRKKALPHEVH